MVIVTFSILLPENVFDNQLRSRKKSLTKHALQNELSQLYTCTLHKKLKSNWYSGFLWVVLLIQGLLFLRGL